MMKETAARGDGSDTLAAGRLARENEGIVKDLAQMFKLLADETRLRILLLLGSHDELHVRGLCMLLKQSQPAVSHHLGLLRVAGLIASRRDGKHNYYRVVPEVYQQMIRHLLSDMPTASETKHVDHGRRSMLAIRRPAPT